jgi:hypothetical protein
MMRTAKGNARPLGRENYTSLSNSSLEVMVHIGAGQDVPSLARIAPCGPLVHSTFYGLLLMRLARFAMRQTRSRGSVAYEEAFLARRALAQMRSNGRERSTARYSCDAWIFL